MHIEISLGEVLKKSELLFKASEVSLSKLKFQSSPKTRITLALLYLSFSHQKSIHFLIESKNYSSAFALLRPQFEAFVRGVWYQTCATDQEIEGFLEGNEPPKFKRLSKDIDTKIGLNIDAFGDFNKEHWGHLCDLTHGGFQQVFNLSSSEGVIKQNFDLDSVKYMLISSILFGHFNNVIIASVAQDSIIQAELSKTFSSIFPDISIPIF